MLLIFDIIVFIVFVVLPFGLSFLFRRNKLIRRSLQIVSLLLFIWFIYSLVGKSSLERQGEKEIVGIYKLNADSSRFKNVDLKRFSDITLTVKSNNTFIINRHLPFFNAMTGRWNLRDDGDISFIEYQLDNENYSHQMFPYNYWTFHSYDLKGATEDDRIIFTRD